MHRHELSDEEWDIIAPLLPNNTRGVERVDDRRVINGMLWRFRTGSSWRDLPERALGRKSWLFAGSDRGADRAAFMATLIMTVKLNDIDPQAWLADVLARIADTPITKLEQLLPWNWIPPTVNAQAA
ncbi:transposase (plasmid) [Neorhizobium sp. NCHU2750]|nr:transposase [Neorhizobium sp. NCHU2750]